MSFFRCAACGSQNISTDTQTAGIKYDYVKGAVGTVLFGTGGAVAGVTNKQQRVYKCSDCGMTLSYPMSESIKNMIDEGVVFAEKRNHLYLKGMLVTWSELKSIYKNIESGPADKAIEERAAFEKNNELKGIELLKSRGTASEDDFNHSIQLLLSLEKKFAVQEIKRNGEILPWSLFDRTSFSKDNLPSLADYLSFLSAMDIFYTNYFRFRPYDTPDKEEYRLFDKFICVYIALKFYLTTGSYPVIRMYNDKYDFPYFTAGKEQRFLNFIKENAFYVQFFIFLIKFAESWTFSDNKKTELLKNMWSTYDLNIDKANMWTYIYDKTLPCYTKNCLVLRYDLFKEGESYIIILPKYKIEKGVLYYNHCAFKELKSVNDNYDYNQSREAYFSYFPEQKKKYDLAVFEHRRSIEQANSEKEKKNKKKEDIKAARENANRRIIEWDSEIDQLSKKVFGKKKAEERKRELAPVIKQQQDLIAKLNAEYEQLETIRIPEPESDAAFMERMNKEYDYFLIWYRIDESGT